MQGNKQFYIRVQEELVPVTEEVYRVYHRMNRRERYLNELDAANGKSLYSDLDTDEMSGEDMIPDMDAKGTEQQVIDSIMIGKLQNSLDLLHESERELVDQLYYKGYSERKLSARTGVPRRTIGCRRSRILSKLKKIMEN